MRKRLFRLPSVSGMRRRISTTSIRCIAKFSQGRLKVGTDAQFFGLPRIAITIGSELSIGDRVVLTSHPSDTALGVSQRTVLRTLSRGARITIGADSGLSGATIVSAGRVSIGQRCLLGADVLIADTDFHPVRKVPRRFAALPPFDESHAVTIEDDVFVGTRALILKGVRIGRGSVVGAGSVVSRDVEAFSIVAGNPAIRVGWVST